MRLRSLTSRWSKTTAQEQCSNIPESATTHPSGRRVRVPSDNPISRIEDDALGRNVLAECLVNRVLEFDFSAGIVMGVLGAWGAGKTSLINLARKEFEARGVPVLDFNPWMFSGTEQLVYSFFAELSAQLRVRLGFSEIAERLDQYGEAFSGLSWLPIVGPWIERGRTVSKMLRQIGERRKEGLSGRRDKLESILVRLERPIVVVLDDIDRLTTSEIRDIFKVVRLTANFPNIIYIVAFDRSRVEDALGVCPSNRAN